MSTTLLVGDYELAQQRRRELQAAGYVYQDGTVSVCPWPGCTEVAVAGWSSCSTHFNDMHPPKKPDVPDFVDEKGVQYFLSMTSDGVSIHARAPEGWSIESIEYDPNCANEGWIKVKIRPALTPRPIKRKTGSAS